MLNRFKKSYEDYENYVYDIIRIDQKANLSESALVKYVIYGIQDGKFKAMMSLQKFDSVTEIICCLKRFETLNNMILPQVSKTVHRKVHRKITLENRRICHNCKQDGHTSRYCMEASRKCSRCCRFGHLSEYCRDGAALQQKNSNEMASSRNANRIENVYSSSMYIHRS